MTTGIITTLRDRGSGSIAPAAGPHHPLAFDRSAVAPGGFAGLRVGQVVAFAQEADPRDRTRQRAIRVMPLAAGDRPAAPVTT